MGLLSRVLRLWGRCLLEHYNSHHFTPSCKVFLDKGRPAACIKRSADAQRIFWWLVTEAFQHGPKLSNMSYTALSAVLGWRLGFSFVVYPFLVTCSHAKVSQIALVYMGLFEVLCFHFAQSCFVHSQKQCPKGHHRTLQVKDVAKRTRHTIWLLKGGQEW